VQTDHYTPGYSTPMLSFMAQRTAEEHARFFLPYLKPGDRVLDAGCGPGSVTLGLARAAAPGQVIGVDIEDSQFEQARTEVRCEGLNVEFRAGSVYQLPLPIRNSTQSTRMQFSNISANQVLPSRSFDKS
jgi:ubiquinone/menaquinone biosynthesis C-methylase UbiE